LPEGWYWKPGGFIDYAPSGMPDFDQKQDAWQDPQDPLVLWSYCGPVAVANSLWWFDSANDPLPPPPPTIKDSYPMVTAYGKWDDHDPQNAPKLVEDLAYLMNTDGQRTGIGQPGTDVYDLQKGIDLYLNNAGLYGYYYEQTVRSPEFPWIEAEVERCEDVILLLGFWQELGPDEWVRIGGHYVTVAGVNSDTWQIALSDPYWDRAETGAPGRVPASHVYPHASSVHNDAQYVSHDIYDVIDSDSPGGPWALKDYALGKDISNFIGQNWANDLLQYQWAYDPSLPVQTEIDYAVAVSPKEELWGIDSWYWWDGEMSLVNVHVLEEMWYDMIYDIEIYFWSEQLGTQLVYDAYFKSPLVVCEPYQFPVYEYFWEPEVVVIHFSDYWEENIGFVFSYPEYIPQ
jgi:hypothetical protein